MLGYETIFVIDASLSDDESTEVLEKIEQTITRFGGSIVHKLVWGRRRLAYPIRKIEYGIYHVWYITGSTETLEELNLQYGYTDSILRSLTVRVEDIEEEKQFFLSLGESEEEDNADDDDDSEENESESSETAEA